MMIANPKQELHQLIDRLDDEGVAEALAYPRWLVTTNASGGSLETMPLDDEPETDEEREAVARALAQLERGEVVSHAQVRRELGL